MKHLGALRRDIRLQIATSSPSNRFGSSHSFQPLTAPNGQPYAMAIV